MKIVTVVGARPQFIKSAPVSRALSAAGIEEVLVHTGQHYDPAMSEFFFSELGLVVPSHHLEIGSGPHGQQTGRILEAVETVLLKEKPDWVLVYGDTNSTLAGALAAVKLHMPVAHVEAGARSFNRRMPEEINRVATDHLSSLLFTASELAVTNLRTEGLTGAAVEMVGDVMLDATRMFSNLAGEQSRILDRLGLRSKSFALTTIHRAENTDQPALLQAIFAGLTALACELPVVLPLHPRTRAVIDAATAEAFAAAGGKTIEPVGYFDMLILEKNAALIVTDSGGVQKEAFYHGVPCITLRDQTEWPELIELGWNTLLPPADAYRLGEVGRMARFMTGKPGSPYGDGRAAECISARLCRAPRSEGR